MEEKRTRVLHLISSVAFLGAERVVCELAASLDSSRFENTIGLLGSPHTVAESFKASVTGSGVTVETFPCAGRFSFRAISLLAAWLEREEVDIIHSHGYKSDVYAFLAARLAGKTRPVATNHNYKTNTLLEKLYRLIDLRILKRFAAIAGVSEDVRQEMIQEGVRRQLVTFIPNGISFTGEKTPLAVRQELGISPGTFVVGCVASLSPEKAHADLIRAFAVLAGRVADSLLLIIGDGPLRGELSALAERAGVATRVRFLGYRRDARELYHAFDSFALVSYTEGLPMALLEAMAARVPAVVSAVGAIPEVVAHLENGIVVQPGDVQAIAEGLLLLARQPDLGRRFGEMGRKDVVERYSVQRMAGDYARMYGQVMAVPV